jgi:hypothetical protein
MPNDACGSSRSLNLIIFGRKRRAKCLKGTGSNVDRENQA